MRVRASVVFLVAAQATAVALPAQQIAASRAGPTRAERVLPPSTQPDSGATPYKRHVIIGTVVGLAMEGLVYQIRRSSPDGYEPHPGRWPMHLVRGSLSGATFGVFTAQVARNAAAPRPRWKPLVLSGMLFGATLASTSFAAEANNLGEIFVPWQVLIGAVTLFGAAVGAALGTVVWFLMG